MTNTVVRARIDEQVKEEAAAVLATIGLTVSDAFRLMMVRIANDKAFPLAAGASLTINTTAAIYGFVASGSAVVVYVEQY